MKAQPYYSPLLSTVFYVDTWSIWHEYTDRRGNPVHLSSRQRQILLLTAEGLSDDEIGRRLGISPLTVKTYIRRLYDRYGVRSRAAIVARWLRDDHDARCLLAEPRTRRVGGRL